MALDRRTFLRLGPAAGGGLLLVLGSRRVGAAAEPEGRSEPPFIPNAFVRLDVDGTLTVLVGRQEMGQGVRSGLPRIVAAEMDADWSRVRLEQADADERFGDQYAGGSNSTQHDFTRLRHAGAAVRWLLVRAAGQRWQVAPARLRTQSGYVVHTDGRRAAYGDLAGLARTLVENGTLRLEDAEKAPLRDLRELPLLGTPMRQLDAPDIVTGRIRFGLDTRIPGLRVAVVARSPSLGARVRAIDDAGARAVTGVSGVVRIDADAVPDLGENSPKPPHGVAVVADSTWAALQGRERLRVEWAPGPGAQESTSALDLQAQRLSQAPPHRVKRADGDVDDALRRASRTLDVVYEQPLVAHAQMEPVSCTAWCRSDRCELWAPTQDPVAARDAAARVTGLPVSAITVHPIRMGGGFGRRYYHDMVVEAMVVSRAVGAPVQVVWTREDDMRHGFYRPGALHRMRGGIDEHGRPIAWEAHLVNASRGEFLRWALPPGTTEFPAGADLGRYDVPAGLVPNLRLQASKISTPIPRGQWRAIEEATNVFATQCFLDELAHLGGRDPLALQLELLGAPRRLPYDDDPAYTWDTGRLARVLRTAAEHAGWGTPLPPGRGRGIACSYANEAYAAMVAEVEMDARRLRIVRYVCAVDCGLVVNPRGVEAQVEGSVMFGLSAALHQEITVERGAVVQGNFDDFPLLRIAAAPAVEVHLVGGGGASGEPSGPPLGAGEMAVPPVAPALANAIFAASGIRARRLPLRHAGMAVRA
ncbi:MAG: molybdopterin cofactor-binding domain-containing protein [Vicinamibacterales bacterium]